MLKWLGFCESQIRKLVEYLGDLNKYKNIHLHPIGYYNPKIVYLLLLLLLYVNRKIRMQFILLD